MKATEINLFAWMCKSNCVRNQRQCWSEKAHSVFSAKSAPSKTTLIGKACRVLLHLCNPLGVALYAQKSVLLGEGHQGAQRGSEDYQSIALCYCKRVHRHSYLKIFVCSLIHLQEGSVLVYIWVVTIIVVFFSFLCNFPVTLGLLWFK